MALRHIGACVAFCTGGRWASPLPFNISLEGSADEEDSGGLASSPATTALFFDQSPTTAVGTAHVDAGFLGQVVSFLERNALFILVAAALVLLVLAIVGRQVFLGRRRKDGAYYPSSFPSSMYVDHRDKTGGAKVFNEVPEDAVPARRGEPVDTRLQLQTDIALAAKRLRAPNKCDDDAAAGSSGGNEAGRGQEDACEAHGGQLDPQLQSSPEERDASEHSEGGGVAAGGGAAPSAPELLLPDKDDARGPPTGRALRPSSLHIHHDSATLQLMAGEKTAF